MSNRATVAHYFSCPDLRAWCCWLAASSHFVLKRRPTRGYSSLQWTRLFFCSMAKKIIHTIGTACVLGHPLCIFFLGSWEVMWRPHAFFVIVSVVSLKVGRF